MQGAGFSLSVYSANQIVKIGTSVDYGVCRGKRKDGMACTLVINKYVTRCSSIPLFQRHCYKLLYCNFRGFCTFYLLIFVTIILSCYFRRHGIYCKFHRSVRM